MKKFFTLSALLAMSMAANAQSSPYTGVAVGDIQDGESYYIYNVDFGTWLGDNKRNKVFGWTSHAELGSHGRNFTFEINDAGWTINPKTGGNHSLNAVGLYMDTGRNKSKWTPTAITYGDVSNVMEFSGEVVWDKNELQTKTLSVNDSGDMDEACGKHNVWQLVSREERLEHALNNASEENPINISGLILGGTFPVADDYRNVPGPWVGERGDNASGGDGFYHCNRVWELWGITDRNIYQDIALPNGKYRVCAKAIYVSSGGDGMSSAHYDAYLNGSEPTLGYIYANDQQTPMVNAYSLVTDEKVAGHNTKDLGNGKWAYNGTNEFSTNMFEGKGEVTPMDVTVTTGNLRVGFKVEGGNKSWILINNIDLYCLGKVTDLTPYREALNKALAEAEEMGCYRGRTTGALANDVSEAYDAAKAVASSTDADVLAEATQRLDAALRAAKDVDTSLLEPTVGIANKEGVYVADIFDYLENGTENRVDELLRLVRNRRKLNAAVKVDVSKVTGSEPDNGEFYLLNVGTGLYLDITADWSTHISIDNPGLLFTLEKGSLEGINNGQVYFLRGGGFNGFNWNEEYFDKNGEHKFHFVPVEGKERVYYLNVFDNYDWHFVYDINEDVCDGNTHYWNAVQKRNNNTYKNDLNAQWMLVSPAERTALLQKATEAEPIDATHFINNPNFTYNAKGDAAENITRGWTGAGTVCNGNRRAWYLLEWFEKDVDMKQTLTGLPAGKYQLSATAFFRDGTSDNEAAKVVAGETPLQLASLVAINGKGETSSSLLPNVTSEHDMVPGIGDVHGELPGEFACWPWQAQEYFQTGRYKVTTPVIEVGADGTLTIGIEMKNNGATGNWVVADNFRLTCLGTYDVAEIGTAGYATYVAPYDVTEVPAGVEAYAAQNMTTYVHLEPVTEIPAGSAVVLKGEQGSYAMPTSYAEATMSVTNDLLAATEDITADGTQYVLAEGTQGVGFYRATEGVLAKGKGYLQAKDALAKVLFFDKETSINGIEAEAAEEGSVIYNLAGQRVSKVQKGINIVDGKKRIY